MEKVRIENNVFMYPMPMVLVGAVVEGRPNFMAAAWVSRVNSRPPLMAVAIGDHHTRLGIAEHEAFSINIPGVDLIRAVDHCGLVSGKQEDKSTLFELFTGELEHAPMIQQCPLTMECRLLQSVPLPRNTLFIGDVVAAYCAEQHLTDGKPDVLKMQPFMLTMPDNRYWTVGEYAGKAWGIGKDLVRGAESPTP